MKVVLDMLNHNKHQDDCIITGYEVMLLIQVEIKMITHRVVKYEFPIKEKVQVTAINNQSDVHCLLEQIKM